MGPGQGGGRRCARFTTPLGLFLLAFLVRCLPFPSVFLREGTALIDPDSYYHMRRIVFSVMQFPKTLGFGGCPARC